MCKANSVTHAVNKGWSHVTIHELEVVGESRAYDHDAVHDFPWHVVVAHGHGMIHDQSSSLQRASFGRIRTLPDAESVQPS